MSVAMRFERLQDKQCENVIRFLLKEKIYFILWCQIEKVSFSPELPQDIVENFRSIMPFALMGYTFESLAINQKGISFEAGFGTDNIGSFVDIDFKHILTISIKDAKDKESSIFVRLNSQDFFIEENFEEDDLKNSMEAIMSNPHNKQYL